MSIIDTTKENKELAVVTSAALTAGKADGKKIGSAVGKADTVRRELILSECVKFSADEKAVSEYTSGFALGLIQTGIPASSVKVMKSDVRAIMIAYTLTTDITVNGKDEEGNKTSQTIHADKTTLEKAPSWATLIATARAMLKAVGKGKKAGKESKDSKLTDKAQGGVIEAVKAKMTLQQVLATMHECLNRLAVDLGPQSQIADCTKEIQEVRESHVRMLSKIKASFDTEKSKKAAKNAHAENASDAAFKQLQESSKQQSDTPSVAQKAA